MSHDHQRPLDLRKRQHATSLRCRLRHRYARSHGQRCRTRHIRTVRSRVLDRTPRLPRTPRSGRCAQPTSWSSTTNGSSRTARFPKGPGYWAVTRHEDVWAASRNPQVFISGRGVNIGDIPQEMNEFIGSMIAMDDPRHFRLRNIVAKGFTPKQITQVEGYVRTKATAIIDRLLEQFPDGECDFVEQIAAPLPLQIICEMMGIPPEDEAQIFQWTNVILGVGDPEYVGSFEQLMGVLMQMFTYAQQLGEAPASQSWRRHRLGADARRGRRRAADPAGVRFVLHPPGRRRQRDDAQRHRPRDEVAHRQSRSAAAVVRRLRRVTSRPRSTRSSAARRRSSTSVAPSPKTPSSRNTKIAAGQKVVLWYNSANRDETVFAEPDRVRRHPSAATSAGRLRCRRPALLPRRQPGPPRDRGDLRRDPHAAARTCVITGEPDYLQSAFINGIKRMRCAWV